jgi:hypothetical protein
VRYRAPARWKPARAAAEFGSVRNLRGLRRCDGACQPRVASERDDNDSDVGSIFGTGQVLAVQWYRKRDLKRNALDPSCHVAIDHDVAQPDHDLGWLFSNDIFDISRFGLRFTRPGCSQKVSSFKLLTVSGKPLMKMPAINHDSEGRLIE